jgi:hypothetical protein
MDAAGRAGDDRQPSGRSFGEDDPKALELVRVVARKKGEHIGSRVQTIQLAIVSVNYHGRPGRARDADGLLDNLTCWSVFARQN